MKIYSFTSPIMLKLNSLKHKEHKCIHYLGRLRRKRKWTSLTVRIDTNFSKIYCNADGATSVLQICYLFEFAAGRR